MNKLQNFVTAIALPFVEMYEEIGEQPTLGYKFLQFLVATWVLGLFLLFVVGWLTLVVNLIMNPSLMNNATFGVFDHL